MTNPWIPCEKCFYHPQSKELFPCSNRITEGTGERYNCPNNIKEDMKKQLGKNEKLLEAFANPYICLFCGEDEKQHWDDRESYYECDCKDAKETRRIEAEIEKLKRSLPNPNYKIIEARILSPIVRFLPRK